MALSLCKISLSAGNRDYSTEPNLPEDGQKVPTDALYRRVYASNPDRALTNID